MPLSLSKYGLTDLDKDTERVLMALPITEVPKDTVLFRPGDAASGFALLLDGRIDVFLIGSSGRELLLYSIKPGQSCVQSTLGLMGGNDYTGEAISTSPCRVIMIPRDTFLSLMDKSGGFRNFVFRAFANRMQSTIQVLEQVAFIKIETRLAAALLKRAKGNEIHATHQELAVMIGSAREVVSRRLESLAKRGILKLSRGHIAVIDTQALSKLANNPS
ncbi:Crp/Fnr family transcriptional regulator [Amylibacter sp. SFDW26]|uniref:Crp/Fnr family transcriptional regulator n=1 Tax=Amylibacter sp. SFDW26 TaxID=2652722 RepID=UPI001262910F|nr:Crp/Fnr family transcriptional regulator [Amylibacter sp. SFDW26]KAB7615912.1 Crp/Fnr family transcriptional regulator [Amylibacter sp. SFDW26]